MKQSIRPSNIFPSIERDISVLRENISKQTSLSTTINIVPARNQAKTDFSLIGKKLVIYGLAENKQEDKIVQKEKNRNRLLQKLRDRMELKEITVSDCFKLGKEQPYKLKPLVFYIHSTWHHKRNLFWSLRKLKNSIIYIKELFNYADYQNERKILKYKYDLSSLMQKKSEFKIKAGSLVLALTQFTVTKRFNRSVIELLVKETPALDY